MEEYIKPLLSIGTISGVVSAIWLLFSKLILEREKRRINESLLKIKSEIDKQRDKYLFVFKERYKNELNAYENIWSKLTELIVLLEQCNGISGSYIQGIINNDENKNTLYDELESLNKSIKERYDESKRIYYEKKPYLPKEIDKNIKDVVFQSSVLMAGLWSNFIMKSPVQRDYEEYKYIEDIYLELGNNIRSRYDEISSILAK